MKELLKNFIKHTALPVINPYKQPSPWSCYPQSICLLTGIRFDDLIKEIGHDGSKKLDLDKQLDSTSPWDKEAFIYGEMALVLLKFGYSLVQISTGIRNFDKSLRSGYPSMDYIIEFITKNKWRTVIVVEKKEGLHALAWWPCCNKVIDPLIGQQISQHIAYPITCFECIIPGRK